MLGENESQFTRSPEEALLHDDMRSLFDARPDAELLLPPYPLRDQSFTWRDRLEGEIEKQPRSGQYERVSVYRQHRHHQIGSKALEVSYIISIIDDEAKSHIDVVIDDDGARLSAVYIEPETAQSLRGIIRSTVWKEAEVS